MISEQLLELLACPLCHGSVIANPDQSGLLCKRCCLMFPVRDGIPVMLPDEAQTVSLSEPEAPGQ
jgi:uncharacterized protein YbaR (Trm112 family)